MQRLNVIVAQRDATSATQIALALHDHCRSVYLANTPEQIRRAVPKQRADVVVVDLEMVGLEEIEKLHKEYGNLAIVATHRVADEEMWTQSLQAGAVDCCYPQDVPATVVKPELMHHAPSRAA
jgi:DNA-binding NarL/FixJ family response regulator